MIAKTPHAPLDPATDAAALLRRIGFATIVLGVPVAALVSRRASVVLAPLGIALIVIAALIDGESESFSRGLRRATSAWEGAALAIILIWATLSLAWTPFLDSAADKLLNLLWAVGLSLIGTLALPERMRSSNLYLMAVGMGAAIFFALGLAVGGTFDSASGPDDEGRSLERGLVILSVFAWPAIGWLMSRDRQVESLIMAVGVLVAALVGSSGYVVAGLLIGGLAFGLVALRPANGPRFVGLALATVLMTAPLLPFLLRPLVALVSGPRAMATRSLDVWMSVVRDEPLRLITGHGLDASFRGRFAGLLPGEAPSNALFEIWYDFGLVGAAAAAFALYTMAARIGRNEGPMMPSKIAAIVTAVTIAALGIGTSQAWWLTVVGIVALSFVAAERGQFRTTRPKANVLSVANDR